MANWLSYPEKDGLYWFLENGIGAPLLRYVLTDTFELGTQRWVEKMGDDQGLDLHRYYSDRDRWLPIPEPALPPD